MDFGANKTSVEVIKEVSFVGTNLQIFILVLMVNGTKIHGKNLMSSKILIGGIIKYGVNKYGVKCGTSLKFWENKGWINSIDPYGWFQWYFRHWLGRRSLDDKRQ